MLGKKDGWGTPLKSLPLLVFMVAVWVGFDAVAKEPKGCHSVGPEEHLRDYSR